MPFIPGPITPVKHNSLFLYFSHNWQVGSLSLFKGAMYKIITLRRHDCATARGWKPEYQQVLGGLNLHWANKDVTESSLLGWQHLYYACMNYYVGFLLSLPQQLGKTEKKRYMDIILMKLMAFTSKWGSWHTQTALWGHFRLNVFLRHEFYTSQIPSFLKSNGLSFVHGSFKTHN